MDLILLDYMMPEILKRYLPQEKLSDAYKCTCVVGSKAKDKYLEKNEVDAVMMV